MARALRGEETTIPPDCETHGLGGEVWITCVHPELVRSARFVSDELVTGDAICSGCRALPRAEQHENLRMACGACVRARWPIENAS